MADRNVTFSLSPAQSPGAPADTYFPGQQLEFKVVMTSDGGSKVGRSMSSRSVTLSCAAITGGSVTLRFQRVTTVTVTIKPDAPAGKLRFQVTAEDISSTKGREFHWAAGFDTATGDSGTSTASVRKPKATLVRDGAGTIYTGRKLQVKLTLEKQTEANLSVKFSGSAVKTPGQTHTFTKKSRQQSFEVELPDAAVNRGTIEVATLDGYDLAGAKVDNIDVKKPAVKLEVPDQFQKGANTYFPGAKIRVKVTLDTLPLIAGKIKIGGDAVEPGAGQERDLAVNALTQTFDDVPLKQTVAVISGGYTRPKVEIAVLDGYDLTRPESKVEVPLENWKLDWGDPKFHLDDAHDDDKVFAGDKVKFKIKLPIAAKADEKLKLLLVKQGQTAPTAQKQLTIPNGQGPDFEVEVPLALPVSERDVKYTVKLEAVEGNCCGDPEERATVALTVSAPPVVRFDAQEPVTGRKPYQKGAAEPEPVWEGEKGTEYYRLSRDPQEHEIKLSRSFKSANLPTKVKLEGTCLATPVEVLFAPADLEKKIKLKFKDTGDKVVLLKLEAPPLNQGSGGGTAPAPPPLEEAYLTKEGATLAVQPAESYLYTTGTWLTPEHGIIAPGDQFWMQMTMDGRKDLGTGRSKYDKGKPLATVECDAFEEQPGGGTQPNLKAYDVVFKDGEETSQVITWEYPLADSKKGGIRVRPDALTAAEMQKEFPLTFTPLERGFGGNTVRETCQVKGIPALLTVRKRLAYFTGPASLDEIRPGTTANPTKVKVTVNLTVPARTGPPADPAKGHDGKASVLVKSGHASKEYKVGFDPGQDTATFEMELDQRPALDESLTLELEPYTGNVQVATDQKLLELYPPVLTRKRPDLLVRFDPEHPIEEPFNTGEVKVGRKKVKKPVFRVGSTGKTRFNLLLSEPAWEEETLVGITHECFAQRDETVGRAEAVFKKGETRAVLEVAFTNLPSGTLHKLVLEVPADRYKKDAAGAYVFKNKKREEEPNPTKTQLAVADDNNSLEILLLDMPGGFLGKRDPHDVVKADEWIDQDGPFVVGEKAKVSVVLSQSVAGPDPVKGHILCPVTKPVSVEIPKGQRDAEVEVEFCKEDPKVTKKFGIRRKNAAWGPHPIMFHPDGKNRDEFQFLGIRRDFNQVEVYEKRTVQFHAGSAVSPLGTLVKTQEAVIKIQLNHPAPKDGAEVDLTGPFKLLRYRPLPGVERDPAVLGPAPQAGPLPDPPAINGNKVVVPAGFEYREVVVEIDKDEDTAADNVKLAGPNRCTLGTRASLTLPVKTPKVEFDKETWDARPQARKQLVPGTTANLPFILKTPASPLGCHIDIECPGVFQPMDDGSDRRYRLEFSGNGNRDEVNRITRDVRIADTAPLGAASIKFVDDSAKNQVPVFCLPGSPASVDVKEGPRIKFLEGKLGEPEVEVSHDAGRATKLWLQPAGGNFYFEVDGKNKAKLSVAPTDDIDENIAVKIRSAAFGGRVYSVTIPKGTAKDSGIEVEVAFLRGKAFGNGPQDVADADTIALDTPDGWYPSSERGGMCVWVKQGSAPANPKPCPLLDPVLTRREADWKARNPKANYPDTGFCNLSRMLVTEVHGDSAKRTNKRGPFGTGTFEVVTDVTKAEHPDKALVCSGDKAPVIQVTGDHPFGDPHVDSPYTSAHYTFVQVGLSDDSYFCFNHFRVSDHSDVHPFIRVADRSVKPKDLSKRNGAQLHDASYVGPLLPAPLVPIGVVTTLVRRTGSNRYGWGSLIPFPGVGQHIDGVETEHNPTPYMEFEAYRAHQGTDPTDPLRLQLAQKGKRAGKGMQSNWFRDFAARFGKHDVAQYLIEAQSCGLPDLDTGDQANKRLRAVIEVYPADEFCFYIGQEVAAAVGRSLQEGKMIGRGKEFNPAQMIQKDGTILGFDVEGTIRSAKEIEARSDQVDTSGGFATPDLNPVDEEPSDLAGGGGGGVAVGPAAGGAHPDDGFHAENFHPDGKKPYKFDVDPFKPPSLVWYPYQGHDQLTSLAVPLGDKGNKDIWNPDPAASILEDTNSADDVTNQDLDRMLESAVMGKIADITIHFGRNDQPRSKQADQARKGITSILSVFSVLLNLANKQGSGPTCAVGFGFGITINFLNGHYLRYSGWKEASDHRVFWWTSNKIDMQIIAASVEVLFGFSVGAMGVKVEAVIFGNISMDLRIQRTFETVEPGEDKQEYVDKWVESAAVAKLGARLVLGSPSIFNLEGGVKSGYNLRVRTTTRYGVDLEFYFLGIALYGEVKFLGAWSASGDVNVIKGDVAGWPRGTMNLGGRASRYTVYIERSLSQAQARLSYIMDRYVGCLYKYEQLQIYIVADKKIKDGRRYPLTAMAPGLTPRRNEDGSLREDDLPDGFMGDSEDWEADKKKFDKQWQDCKAAWVHETERVKRRRRHYGRQLPTLKDRLERKESQIRSLLDGIFIPKIHELRKVEDEIHALQKRLAERLEQLGPGGLEDSEAEKFYKDAEALKNDDALSYYKIDGARVGNPLARLEKQIQGLQFYALKRGHW